jgi:hypothetical protein
MGVSGGLDVADEQKQNSRSLRYFIEGEGHIWVLPGVGPGMWAGVRLRGFK